MNKRSKKLSVLVMVLIFISSFITQAYAISDKNNVKKIIKVEKNYASRGAVEVNYIDSESGENIVQSNYYKKLKFRTYTYTAKTLQGYTLMGDITKSVTLTKTSPTAKVEFMYKKNETIPSEGIELINKNKGIFSWSSEQILQSNRADTLYWTKYLKMNEIYQSGLFRVSTNELTSFVKDLKTKNNTDVYSLTGDPTWFNKVDSFKTRIDQVKNYNTNVASDSKIKGIVFDVEPWTLGSENWTQEEYAATIKQAYEYAKANNVEMVMVIPFWLDTSISESIIQNSDKIIVMNYNIRNPVKFIEEEVILAKKYNKKIVSAAETMKVNPDYGVDEYTTYYYVGIDRLKSDWKLIDDTYRYENLEFSLHDFKNVKIFFGSN